MTFDMDQPSDRSTPSFMSAGMLLVLREMLRPGAGSRTAPEVRFLARLAIHDPSKLGQDDVERLAAAMIAWGQRHLNQTRDEVLDLTWSLPAPVYDDPHPATTPHSTSARIMDAEGDREPGSGEVASDP